MNHKKMMEWCLDYIDHHFDEEITPQSLAEMAGYSFYYFCHVFEKCNGIPVAEYLRKRRMAAAAKNLGDGESIAKIAKKMGYCTHAGFAKAFKKEFGMSATQFKKRDGGIPMKPKIVERAPIKAIGYSLPPRDGREWNPYDDASHWWGADFNIADHHEYRNLARVGRGEIGMWLRPEENGNMTYFFGPIVEDFSYTPKGMTKIELPAATYVVFATVPVDIAKGKTEFRRTINCAWKYIYEEWADGSGYDFDQDHIAFEYYADEGGVHNGEAIVELFVAIKKSSKEPHVFWQS